MCRCFKQLWMEKPTGETKVSDEEKSLCSDCWWLDALYNSMHILKKEKTIRINGDVFNVHVYMWIEMYLRVHIRKRLTSQRDNVFWLVGLIYCRCMMPYGLFKPHRGYNFESQEIWTTGQHFTVFIRSLQVPLGNSFEASDLNADQSLLCTAENNILNGKFWFIHLF